MTDTAITYRSDFAGLRLEQNERGYIYTPWFTYDWRQDLIDGQPNYGGNNYQMLKERAARAFADFLHVQRDQIIVHEKQDIADPYMERWWRLGTKGPMPRMTPDKKPTKITEPGAIDI